MFDVEELLSKKNQALAMEDLLTKRNTCGQDGVYLSEFPELWKLNKDDICDAIRKKEYMPSIIVINEIVNKKMKRRKICKMNSLDRFITKMLSQKLNRYFNPLFCENSFAFQENKGVVDAVEKIKSYVENGKKYVAEIDIKDFFEVIPLDALAKELQEYIEDEAVVSLIKKYLYCRVSFNGRVADKSIGLLQGNPISTTLSNLYLHRLDCYLQEKNYQWVRYADNIYVYENTEKKAIACYDDVTTYLQDSLKLGINTEKSGVFKATSRVILGYDLVQKNQKCEIKKHMYRQVDHHSTWNESHLEHTNGEYHILSDGIIGRHDYSILFENEKKQHYIPAEVTNQINFYGNVTMESNVLQTLSAHKIRASFFDKHGRQIGIYIPESVIPHADVLLAQCRIYLDPQMRLDMARRFEIAGLHNIRANLRYYEKKNQGKLKTQIESLSKNIVEANNAKTVDELMLIEANARRIYYNAFNVIIHNKEYYFSIRTKRPPKDCINACISFGNTLLYNFFLCQLWKRGIDPRIGIVHASNKRAYSLNLDFADLFKPIVTDRIIFTLLNKKMLVPGIHFIQNRDGGVYLTADGKKIFLDSFESKMGDKLIIKGETYTYRGLMEMEINNFKRYLSSNQESYKPYKYY